ncbi:MAG: hypothetical protein II034_06485 [Muribaculaceae bacterium]|nr:hypothetical protein [Muribaculaceae bacterium]
MNKCNFYANYFHFLLQFAFCGVSFGGVGACFGGYFFILLWANVSLLIVANVSPLIVANISLLSVGESPLMNGQAMALLTNHYWPTMIDKQL